MGKSRNPHPRADALFTRRLREFRERCEDDDGHRLSQQALADRMEHAGFPVGGQSGISDLECGRREIKLGEALALCYILKTSLAEMVKPLPDSYAVALSDDISVGDLPLRQFLTDGLDATATRVRNVKARRGATLGLLTAIADQERAKKSGNVKACENAALRLEVALKLFRNTATPAEEKHVRSREATRRQIQSRLERARNPRPPSQRRDSSR